MTANWMNEHSGETVVVKLGGNAMTDDGLSRAFCDDIVSLTRAGIRVVVTHGGGPQISAALSARGVAAEFRGGLRVTSEEAVDIVREVLVNIGSELAHALTAAGASATALAGNEHNLFSARRAGTVVDGEVVDLGQVGEVVAVDTRTLHAVLDVGGVPVVSAVGSDVHDDGLPNTGLLNINADAAASSLAVALGADWLLILTDVPGLYRDWPNRDSLVDLIDTDDLAELVPHLESGMIPKVVAARTAVLGGVGGAAIVDGRAPHVLVSAPFGTTGTRIIPVERTTP